MSEPLNNDLTPAKVVTMLDVAKQAGVSKATVSRVLNGSGPVDAEVAERVRAVIATLKYQPNRAARALSNNRSIFIGLLVGDIQNPFTITLLSGVEEEVRRNNYLLIICSSPATTDHPEEQSQYLEILAASPVAGAIIVPMQERFQALEVLKARNVPMVVVDQRVSDPSLDSVHIDNIRAAKEAVTHLIQNGYKRIGVVTGPKRSTTASERLTGYRQALQEAGISHDPALERRGAYIEEVGEQATEQLLALDPPVEAIFTANNRMTAGTLLALHRQNKRVPEDIALVCFDEVTWDIPYRVPLTTIVQPAYELGRIAATRLLERLKDINVSRQEIILPHQLIVRESSHARC